MKPLLLNTFDLKGGAAIATYRLHQGFRSRGVDSAFLAQSKSSDDYTVLGPQSKLQKLLNLLRPDVDGLATRFNSRRPKNLFSPAWLPERLAARVAKLNPDLVHLFWVTGGFVRIETLKKLNQPIVWTLHDMWPFTGGCHYDDECGRFTKSCGKCPVLHSEKNHDLSRRIWARKKIAWGNTPLVVVATSNWLAEMARASSLFKDQRIEIIPNCIDTERYKPGDKAEARNVYGLPQDKKLILFSAVSATSDRRKGHHFLIQALAKMAKTGWQSTAELVIIGTSAPQNPPDLGMKVHYMGYLGDDISQVLLYSAADVVVTPSLQENLANTVMESLACGTPVVAFNIGGMPDMIDHQKNGYLAEPFEADDLAAGISWVIEDKERHAILCREARQTVLERYTVDKVVDCYLSLYQSILK